MNKYLLSTGGVGTVYIRKLLGLKKTNERGLVSPHSPDPTIVKPGGRPVYVFGDPLNQVLSLHRRHFMRSPYMHCKHVGGDINGLRQRKEWTLQQYLSNGIDYFRIAEHLFRWIDFAERNYTIMFVKYSGLSKYMPRVGKWWNVSTAAFQFRKRRSDWRKIPEKQQLLLKAMFCDSRKRILALPTCFVLEPGEGHNAITQA